jgi:hypothetical protein
MTLLQVGIAYTLVPNQVYALPSKAVLLSTPGIIEQSWDGTNFSSVSLTNGTVALASLFIRSILGTIVSLKEYSATVNLPGSGSGGGSAQPYTGNVLISDPNPGLVILDSDGSSGTNRWRIRIDDSNFIIDSESAAGVSYGRPLSISVYNGGIQSYGPIVAQSSMSCSTMGITEMPFSSLPGSVGIGTIANISDSTVNAIGGTIAGGGAFHVMGRWNGTAWKVAAL